MALCKLKEFIAENGFNYIFDAPMNEFTTLKIGGKADILVQPESAEQIHILTEKANEEGVGVTFIGNGSNILVRDNGVRGLVIKIGPMFAKTYVEGDIITAECGISMARLASIATENALTGFEFASGIPGTLGGGIVMNAGAYKGEIKDVVFEVTALLPDGTLRVYKGDELDFSYRHSIFTDSNMLVVEARLKLNKGDREQIIERVNELSAKRRKTQPLEYPSAGSAFKRPSNGFAAAMIDESGLKGYSVGGAQVSEKHAGFVINRAGASARDVEELLSNVREIVHAHCGTWLEPEIIIIGDKN